MPCKDTSLSQAASLLSIQHAQLLIFPVRHANTEGHEQQPSGACSHAGGERGEKGGREKTEQGKEKDSKRKRGDEHRDDVRKREQMRVTPPSPPLSGC